MELYQNGKLDAGTRKIAISIIASVIFLAVVGVLLFILFFAGGSGEVGYRSIKINRIEGIVQVANRGEEPYAAYESMHLYDGFSMITRDESYSRMLLDDDKYIKLEENSLAYFKGLRKTPGLPR